MPSKVSTTEGEFAEFLSIRVRKDATAILLDFLRGFGSIDYGIPSHFKRVNSSSMSHERLVNSILLMKVSDSCSLEIFKQKLIVFLEEKKVDFKFSVELLPINKPESKEAYCKLSEFWPMTFTPIREPVVQDFEIESYLEIVRSLETQIANSIEGTNDKRPMNGVAIFDPFSRTTLLRTVSFLEPSNPIAHSVMVAINEFAADLVKNESPQYLLNGLDVIVCFEPCLMCAMALVHSRARRVIYCKPNPMFLGAANSKLHICKLGVNHKPECFVLDSLDAKLTYVK